MKHLLCTLLLMIMTAYSCAAQENVNSEIKRSKKITISDFYARSTLSLSQKRGGFLMNPGYSLSQSVGYKINPHFQLGIGVSKERYSIGREIHFAALFAEASAYLKPTGISPYGTMRLGAGFGQNKATYSSSNSAGLHANPEIGMRFPICNFDLMLGFGLKIQNVTYRFNESDEFYGYSERYKVRRSELRLGFMF